METSIKPRKIPAKVEDGNDDCGEDLKGLGCGAHTPMFLWNPTVMNMRSSSCHYWRGYLRLHAQM
eukprot:631392-Pyramimonas_sp.AAC.1